MFADQSTRKNLGTLLEITYKAEAVLFEEDHYRLKMLNLLNYRTMEAKIYNVN